MSASVNVGESEFAIVASAAVQARLIGRADESAALDKLARKINAALSNAKYARTRRRGSPYSKPLSWEDVPSVFDTR